MLVREVMSTGVVSASTTDRIRSVVDEGCRLVGVIALRDVLLPMYPNYGDYIHDQVHSRDFVEMEEGYSEVLGRQAYEIMTRNPMTVAPDDPILKAASYMGLKNLRRMPVVEDGRLVGVVGISDINRGLCLTRGLCAVK